MSNVVVETAGVGWYPISANLRSPVFDVPSSSRVAKPVGTVTVSVLVERGTAPSKAAGDGTPRVRGGGVDGAKPVD